MRKRVRATFTTLSPSKTATAVPASEATILPLEQDLMAHRTSGSSVFYFGEAIEVVSRCRGDQRSAEAGLLRRSRALCYTLVRMERTPMRKRLSAIGNSLGLVIEKPILELLHIDRDTELDMSTDGQRLIITPVQQRRAKVLAAAK